MNCFIYRAAYAMLIAPLLPKETDVSFITEMIEVIFWHFIQFLCAHISVIIRDTQKDGTTHNICILGRSTCWPQIYRVCLGILRQIISLKNKFWTIHEQQS